METTRTRRIRTRTTKTIRRVNNEREYTIGREKIDQQRMSSAVGVMTKAGEVFGRMWKKLGNVLCKLWKW